MPRSPKDGGSLMAALVMQPAASGAGGGPVSTCGDLLAPWHGVGQSTRLAHGKVICRHPE